MITDELLEQLRYKGEGSDLDYKSDRPAFIKASDIEKSELPKDILALANAHRVGTAYILFGFKENVPHPAEVVGYPPKGLLTTPGFSDSSTRSWKQSSTSATRNDCWTSSKWRC